MLQVKPMVDEFSAPLWKSTWTRQVLIEVVGVTENRFVLVAGVNGANDEFLVLGVITGFDVRLWIDIEVRRPVHESNRNRYGSFVSKPNFGAENPVIRLETREIPRTSAHFVRPISACNSYGFAIRSLLRLKTERQIARALKLGRHDLAQAFGGREGGRGENTKTRQNDHDKVRKRRSFEKKRKNATHYV